MEDNLDEQQKTEPQNTQNQPQQQGQQKKPYRRPYYRRNYNQNRKPTGQTPNQPPMQQPVIVQTVSFKKVSIVVPLLNEEESLRPLYQEIRKALKTVSCDYEILFIDARNLGFLKTRKNLKFLLF